MPSRKRSRRQFVRGAAAAAVSAVIAGCGSDDSETPTDPDPTETDTETETDGPGPTETATASPTPTPVPEIVNRFGDRFGSIVDVAARGADATGQQRIDDVVADAIGDDTLLYFPDGRYKLGSVSAGDVTNLGVVSLPSDETVISPAVSAEEMSHRFLEFEDVGRCVLDGFTLDYGDPRAGGAVKVTARQNLEVRNVTVEGKIPDRSASAKPVAFHFEMTEESGTGLVENVVATDGGHERGNSVGMYVGKDHAGELTFRDCEIEGFPDNGLYASAPGRDLDGFSGKDGTVHVRGGRYANNNISNVRIGSTGSTVKDVRIVIDEVPPHPEDASLNVRGLRLRGRGDLLVENCEVTVGENAGRGFGAIVVHPATGSATVRDVDITIDRDEYRAIRAFPPTGDGSGRIDFENVAVSGSAGGGETVAIEGRDGTTFRDCTIEQSGERRAGMVFADSEDCLVADSTIQVTGEPILTEDATVDQQNLTTR